MITLLIFFVGFGLISSGDARATKIQTCGRPDKNGVSKIIITASSPLGEINLYSVQFDTARKLAITSTALHNELNQIKAFNRSEVFRPYECTQVRGHEMNCAKTYKFTPAQKEKSGNLAFDRGHLVPANPNRFSEEALNNTFYCVNMAPQDPYVNRKPWQHVEALSLKKFKDFPGFVMTGLCDEDSVDGVTREGYAIPACYWKMMCYKEGGVGETQVVGYIADNSLVNGKDDNEEKQRWKDVTTPRSQSDIEKLTRVSYIEKAWRDAGKDLLKGRKEKNAPDPEDCIAAKSLPANVEE